MSFDEGGLGIARKRLIERIIVSNWSVKSPIDKSYTYNELLFIIQEMMASEGKSYLELGNVNRGYEIFRNFVELLLYRNLANYDSMILITGEKGCLTDDTIIYTRDKPKGIALKKLIDKGPTKVLSYNSKKFKYEYKLSDGVEFAKYDYIYEVKFDNNKIIKCTGDHPFLLTNGKYKLLRNIENTDEICCEDFNVAKLLYTRPLGKQSVYDVVNVRDNHNFIANGFIVSNTGKSSAAIMLARYWCKLIGKVFDPAKHMAYNNKDVVEKIESLEKFSVIVCLHENTIINIKQDNKYYKKKIKKLVNLDNYEVLTYNQEKDVFEYQKPQKTVFTKLENTYTIQLENGLKIKATKEHLFLTKEGIYKTLEKLTESDELVLNTKKCTICDNEFFNINNKVVWCSKLCKKEYIKIYLKEYRKANELLLKEKSKIFRKENKERLNKKSRDYYLKNLEQRKKRNKEYYYEHKEVLNKKNREYQKNNRSAINTYVRKYYKENFNNKIEYRIFHNLKTRMMYSFRVIKLKRKLSIKELLDCDITFFIKHLELQFKEGMNWNNYGLGKNNWSIDHIIPCYQFNLNNEEEQRKCFSYKNIQPLWNIENWKKCKLIIEQGVKKL